jgi:AAA domain, putative AbiEii toxin, Type IV TA system
MRIVSIKIGNFKCFAATESITLDPHMNLVVGKNNSGKSAFLEAVRPIGFGRPHRTAKTMPAIDATIDEESRVEFCIEASGEEIKSTLLNQGTEFWVLHPPHGDPKKLAEGSLAEVIQKSSQLATFTRITSSRGTTNFDWKVIPLFGSVRVDNKAQIMGAAFAPDKASGKFKTRSTNQPQSNYQADFGLAVLEALLGRVYKFDAQRVIPSQSEADNANDLRPTGANLASALQTLSFGHEDQLRELLRRVFPLIDAVSAKPMANKMVRILVWPTGTPRDRTDLAIPLDESGSGVAQVMAILYVLVTAPSPRTICIDEPNSFLHPEASRKLVGILAEYPQHQFIITTHSPEVIAAAKDGKVLLLRWSDGESTIVQSEEHGIALAREALVEVGVRLSDVFSSDQIIWVEGDTEEKSFPLIKAIQDALPSGTAIIGVVDTNSFARKRIDETWRIYTKLATSGALIPPLVGLVLDRDERTEEEMEDLRRRSKGKIQFLDREMFENYLIDAPAIADVINGALPEGATNAAEVAAWIELHGAEERYFKKGAPIPEPMTVTWRAKVHGARLLHALFSELSKCDLQYQKTAHGPLLTERIVNSNPAAFDEITALISSLFNWRRSS